MSDPGTTVFNGRYELHRRLGRGGMAEVFLARDQLLDRPVAVKVLFPEFATDAAFVERFRREATAAANLNHPNIVGVYDWGEADGTYFIVMEYVDGRTLSEILRDEGPLHPDRAADVGADVAAALAEREVAVWHGNYYAWELEQHLELAPHGAIRAGFVHYNDEADADRLVEAVRALGS